MMLSRIGHPRHLLRCVALSRCVSATQITGFSTDSNVPKAKWMGQWKRPSDTDLALKDADLLPVPNNEIAAEEVELARAAIQEVLGSMEVNEDEHGVEEEEVKPRPLEPHEHGLVQTKLQTWRTRFEDEWRKDDEQMFRTQQSLEEALRADPSNDDARSELAMLNDARAEEEFYRDLIKETLPTIANRYVRDAKPWAGREQAQLNAEIQKELTTRHMKEYAKQWAGKDPLRDLSRRTRDEQEVPPLPVRASTLLEYIDPRVAQTNKEIGPKDDVGAYEHEMIDMSDPSGVMEFLASKGYTFAPDGSFAHVDREAVALDPDQRILMRDGIDESGKFLTGERLRQAIAKSLELSSMALKFKIRKIHQWAITESRKNMTAPMSVEQILQNPEILPEDLRPTTEDLDPDAKPPQQTFSPVIDKCLICNKPRHVKATCYNSSKTTIISHTNIELLNNYVNEYGMILPRSQSALCSKYQRKVARAIKRARQMGLMPYNTRLKFGEEVEGKPMELFDVFNRAGAFADSPTAVSAQHPSQYHHHDADEDELAAIQADLKEAEMEPVEDTTPMAP